ncbi:rRNA processing protein [Nitzschia inconspicua]|uniref:rRNA processing protein n=1 Tax=Nitzschia inconspicua TaxID=303405 RepID=A0A9K3KYJ4_9STRA|nr:rRNA processing protein [Nitzschia inconspicua]
MSSKSAPKSVAREKQHRRPYQEHDRSKDSSNRPFSSRRNLSLDTFAQRKGQVRALEEFKKRKEHKRLQTAKALRKYQKVMKQEGLEAGKGASRKRLPTDTRQGEESVMENPKIALDPNETGDGEVADNHPKKRRKTNPLEKAVYKAEQTKQQAVLLAQQREEQEKERQQKLRQRKRQSKLLQKRTKRGQPIMKHMVSKDDDGNYQFSFLDTRITL